MSENETGQTDLGGDILGVAKKVASAGDRWFVSFARGLGRAAGRLRKETNIVTSSACFSSIREVLLRLRCPTHTTAATRASNMCST